MLLRYTIILLLLGTSTLLLCDTITLLLLGTSTLLLRDTITLLICDAIMLTLFLAVNSICGSFTTVRMFDFGWSYPPSRACSDRAHNTERRVQPNKSQKVYTHTHTHAHTHTHTHTTKPFKRTERP
jgi:hypothetical protein